MSRNKCLILSERIIIEKGINEGTKKNQIAGTVGKDESTIAKEIKLHRKLTYKCPLPLECANYKKCVHNRKCTDSCLDFIQFKCNRRDRTPGACNGCNKYSGCRFNKFRYYASTADSAYKDVLVSSREGFNITDGEIKAIADIIVTPLINGQSPYAVLQNHPEIKVSEKTLYVYIENGLFKKYGLDVMLLRRYIKRKIPKKKKNLYKKRNDWKFLQNRTFSDLKELLKENPNLKIAQMDTVYNDMTNGPFIQTIKIVNLPILIAIYHEEKTAKAMVDGVNLLEQILGKEIFMKYIDVITPDRGSEFFDAVGIETALDGSCRCKVFYCDPMQSCQKASLENNHEDLRYVFPKEKDLRKLGLTSQESLNIVLSNINSYPKEKLNGKTPIEYVKFLAPDLAEKLKAFGIVQIPKDKVVLTKDLLKKNK